MKKRLLAVLLALCLALALMPAAVFAADEITVPNNGEMDKNHPDLLHFDFPAEYRYDEITIMPSNGEPLVENQDYVLYRYESPYFCFTQEFLLSLEEGLHDFVFTASPDGGEEKNIYFFFTLPETYSITLEVTPEGAGAIAVEGYSDSQQKIYYAPKDQELEMGPAIDENLYRFVGWKVNGQEPDPTWVDGEYLFFIPDGECTVTLELEALKSALRISPSTLDFGTVKVGYDQPDYQTVAVTNSGETNLYLPIPDSEYYDIAGLSSGRMFSRFMII